MRRPPEAPSRQAGGRPQPGAGTGCPSSLPTLHAVRDGLALQAHALTELNRAAAATPAVVAIELDASGRPQRVTRRSGPAASQVAAALAEAAIEFLAEYDQERLRQCAAQDCILLFYATHAKRRWCSANTFGTRERVRRH